MRVAKWGNSLAIRLPETVVQALELKAGDEIEVLVGSSRRFEIQRDRRLERALRALRALQKPLPAGFRFDRDEANAR